MTTKTPKKVTDMLMKMRESIEICKASVDKQNVSMDNMSGAQKIAHELETMKAQMRLQQTETNYLETLRVVASKEVANEPGMSLDYDALNDMLDKGDA